MALRPGKSPVPSSYHAWGRGDGAAAVGMGKVAEGFPGQPGPAGFKVTCKAQVTYALLAPRMETSWDPPHLPRAADPWEGPMALPTPMAAAQLAGDSALHTPTPSLTHWGQLEATLLQAGRLNFCLPAPLGEQAEAPAESCLCEALPGHPAHLSSQGNTQGCSWYPSIAQGASTQPLDTAMRSQPYLSGQELGEQLNTVGRRQWGHP